MLKYFGDNPDVFNEVLQPVGTWRFLTPLDTIQEGDLYRYLLNEDPSKRVDAYSIEWTEAFDLAGYRIGDMENWEWIQVIRPVEGTTVYLFQKDEE